MPHPIRRSDLTGQTFERLTVTGESEIRARNRAYWLCRCVCGNSKWVIADALKSGATRSCGCLNNEVRIRTATVHGCGGSGKQSPEYKVWHHMKQRCLNPHNVRYARYGGRGITVCHQWLDFPQFLADMGPRPSPKHSIERRNNDGNYEPSNCIWATTAMQNRNLSRNRNLTFNGETLCVTDWAARLGIKQNTLLARIARWPLDRALTELPTKSSRR